MDSLKTRVLALFLLLGFSSMLLAEELTIPKMEDLEDQHAEIQKLSYIDAIVLGAVEGLTEYLPISSTGHLILTDYILTDSKSVDSGAFQEAKNAYLIVIQGGAILAVLFIYWDKVLSILMGLMGKNPEGLSLGLKVFVAFIPAALTGPFLNDWIEIKLFNPAAVSLALAIGAMMMIVAEKLHSGRGDRTSGNEIAHLKYPQALLIGLMQCVAMWPGMSRSMVTIVGGYWVGLSPRAAAEFSFMLGLLTLTAASVYSLLGTWETMAEQIAVGPAVAGIIVATIVAFIAVKWFVAFLSKHGLMAFAIYRLVLAGAIFFWLVD